MKANAPNSPLAQLLTGWVTVNLNDYVRFKVTPHGLDLLRQRHDARNLELGGFLGEFVPPEVDADGWSETQLWFLMEEFGEFIHIGASGPLDTMIQVQARVL